ncbi:MAG: chitobiase/beta-hexosaminidase C-terminal domain-containing protein [Prevotellaceae bacterium]|nr:chitobiase/beta-hexosaminidase C-terminal domain-containing protein [Candidatus Minthosoma equi]
MTSIGSYAFWECASLTSITIPSSVTSIGNRAFSGCRTLSTIISEIVNPFPVSDIFSYYDSATLYVPYYSIGLYEATDGWKEFKNIVPIEGPVVKTIILSITTPRNQDVTIQASVLWYDADGKQFGSGNSLNGIEEGDTIYYSILLSEELGRKYQEVIMQQVVVGSDTESLTCILKEIPRIELAGRVSATDIDKTAVTVTVKQMLNGKYEQTYTTQTNNQGQFKIEVYDDVTDITLNGNPYFEAILHRDGFGGNANMGVIPMNLLSGFVIAADISLKKAVAASASEDIAELPGGLNNIEFSLYNATTDKVLTDFTVQNGKIIIKSGANVGDEIELTAKSKQGIFADAMTSFTTEEGTNAFVLELTELGGIDVTCASSSNGKTIGYLYDTNSTLVAKGGYVGDNLAMRHLPSGNYTLVTMGSSALLGNLTNLSDLNSIGLTEGSDFVRTSLSVADGVLSASSISEVPRMDDTRFYYTSDNAYFSANKTSVTVGNYIALSAHVDLKSQYQGKVDDVLVTVELPEGCLFVENSVMANRQVVAHTYSGNKLMMNLSQEQWQSEIRFCVIPVLKQTYAITAMASLDIDGGVSQPIGTAQFESKGLSLNTLSYTADTNITINGTAKGKSDVSIYDNDVFIGKTTSKADGTWTATCELYKPFSHSFHDIYAKITDENGQELASETKQVEYDKNNIVPKSVTMTYYNGWYKENKTVEFNMIEGTTSPNSWPFYSAADFTFLADFTKNDSSLVKNVNIKVLNSDGTVRTLPAMFDGKQGKWVATTRYSSADKLPQNVTVEYDWIQMIEPFDSARIKDDLIQFVNLIQNYGTNIDTTKFEIIEAGESKAIFKYQTYTMTNPVYIRIEQLDYDTWIKELESKDYFTIENNGVYNIVDSISQYSHKEWIWSDENKQILYIETCIQDRGGEWVEKKVNSGNRRYANIFEGTRSIGNLLAKSVLNIFCNAGDIAELINDYNEAHRDLLTWLSKYDILLNYQMQLYNQTRQLIEAKCPDGSLKLSSNLYNGAKVLLQKNFDDANSMRKQFKDNLDRLEKDMIRNHNLNWMSCVTGSMFNVCSAVNTLNTAANLNSLRHVVDSFVGNIGITTASDLYSTFVKRTTFYTSDQLYNWYVPASTDITNKYLDLQNRIKNSYKICKNEGQEEEQDDEPLDEKSDNKPNFSGSGSTGIIDPSGYVYEAVLSNRLEGVTATCYQQTQTEDMYGDITEEAIVWNAEDYSQQNPLRTDKNGFYRWDVPQGMWQVKYEKEGYETVYSGWLPVPPPQLDVNIGMKQSTPPSVKQMRGTESGITIDMTKYMLPASITTANITVSRNGKNEQGTIEMLNAEQAPLSGETYVQKVKFVPNTRFNISDDVVVTVHKGVESYCGVPMTADYQETVKIESEITDIVVDASVVVPYQGERELRVLVLPKEASAGRKLYVRSSSSMIASVSEPDLVIKEEGSAIVTILGELPGGAILDFEVEGTDVTATSKIQVKNMGNEVLVPTASIPNGESVVKGTKVELSCDTEGATIYYTLDGSCPCDEGHRILYTEPITITENVTISAIAVVPGLYDSDVAEFKYTIDGTNIDTISFDDTISLYPLPMKDQLNVMVNEKKINQVTITSTEGVVMVQSKGSSNIVSLNVNSLPSGIYIISVSTEGKIYTRKVMK